MTWSKTLLTETVQEICAEKSMGAEYSLPFVTNGLETLRNANRSEFVSNQEQSGQKEPSFNL